MGDLRDPMARVQQLSGFDDRGHRAIWRRIPFFDIELRPVQRVIVIEFKVGTYSPADARQVEDYALDLRDFHEASHNLKIIPVVCAPGVPDTPFTLDGTQGVASVYRCNHETLRNLLLELAGTDSVLDFCRVSRGAIAGGGLVRQTKRFHLLSELLDT
jgi:hypothetical protein